MSINTRSGAAVHGGDGFLARLGLADDREAGRQSTTVRATARNGGWSSTMRTETIGSVGGSISVTRGW